MENFLINISKWFAYDKCLHFIGGMALFDITLFILCMIEFFSSMNITLSIQAFISLVVCIFIGIEKEYWYDKNHPPHEVSILDAIATGLGGLYHYCFIILFLNFR